MTSFGKLSLKNLYFCCTLVLLVSGLLNLTIPLSAGGLSIKVHELIFASISICGMFFSVKYVGKKIILVLFLMLALLIYGFSQNDYAPVLRDYLQIVYFFSLYFFLKLEGIQFNKIDLWILVAVLCFAPLAFSVGVEKDLNRWQGVAYETQLIYNFRIPLVAFLVILAFSFSSKIEVRSTKKVVNFIVLLAMGLLVIGSMFFVRTRGLLLAYFVAIICMTMQSIYVGKKKQVLLSLVALVVGGGLGVVYFTYSDQGGRALAILDFLSGDFSVLTSDYTMYLRVTFWVEALSKINTIFDYIVGCGFGSYLFLDPWGIGDWKMLPASMIHNQALSLFYNGGLAVYFLMFLIFSSFYKKSEYKFLVFVYSVAMFVYSFFTPVFSDSVYASLFFYFLARFSKLKEKVSLDVG